MVNYHGNGNTTAYHLPYHTFMSATSSTTQLPLPYHIVCGNYHFGCGNYHGTCTVICPSVVVSQPVLSYCTPTVSSGEGGCLGSQTTTDRNIESCSSHTNHCAGKLLLAVDHLWSRRWFGLSPLFSVPNKIFQNNILEE